MPDFLQKKEVMSMTHTKFLDRPEKANYKALFQYLLLLAPHCFSWGANINDKPEGCPRGEDKHAVL